MDKIIINGRACSGKDEIADYLVHSYGYKKITFATPIYDIAYKYFNMTTKDRRLLQQIGEKMREIDPDVWVKAAYEEAKKYALCVISDCRRENEYIEGIKNGFTPIRVYADLEKRIQRCVKRDGIQPNIEEWTNDSEIGADGFDYLNIENNGTKDELYRKIDILLEKMNEEKV